MTNFITCFIQLFIFGTQICSLHRLKTKVILKEEQICAAPNGGVLRRFCLKTGIHFAHFGLESGMVFKGTTGAYESIYCFNSK